MSDERVHRKAVRETITVQGVERVPIDRTARRVTSPGVAYTPNFKPYCETWDVPPPLAPSDHPAFLTPEFQDLTGTVRGRMRIIGYLGVRPSGKGSGWLARCSCGKYELRRSQSWKRGMADGSDDMCAICAWTLKVRSNEERYRQGENPGYNSPKQSKGGEWFRGHRWQRQVSQEIVSKRGST